MRSRVHTAQADLKGLRLLTEDDEANLTEFYVDGKRQDLEGGKIELIDLWSVESVPLLLVHAAC